MSQRHPGAAQRAGVAPHHPSRDARHVELVKARQVARLLPYTQVIWGTSWIIIIVQDKQQQEQKVIFKRFNK